jgi:hypothetical protein
MSLNKRVALASDRGAAVSIGYDHPFAPVGGTSANAILWKLGVRIVTKQVAMEAQTIPA